MEDNQVSRHRCLSDKSSKEHGGQRVHAFGVELDAEEHLFCVLFFDGFDGSVKGARGNGQAVAGAGWVDCLVVEAVDCDVVARLHSEDVSEAARYGDG